MLGIAPPERLPKDVHAAVTATYESSDRSSVR
jgi:hypothetical protein